MTSNSIPSWFSNLLVERYISLEDYDEEQEALYKYTTNRYTFPDYFMFFAANYIAENIKDVKFGKLLLRSLDVESIRTQTKLAIEEHKRKTNAATE